MGVRGLRTYLEQNADQPPKHRLSNCHLVVDAANFVHMLYSNRGGFAYEYGGEYDLYSARLRRLFAKFLRCGIRPLFVFDGANDWDGGKLRQQLENVERRVRKSAQLLAGHVDARNRVLPLVTYEVFSDCVREFGFPEATVLTGDADEQTATLAGRLGCPLLTGDSDFSLYPLPGGVVSSFSMDLTDRALASPEPFMTCTLFRQSDCRVHPANCRLRPELAPVWASLVGNDYVSDSEAAEARRLLGVRDGSSLITEAIRWTHRFDTLEACLAELRKHLGADLMQRVDASLRHYRFLPDAESLRLSDTGDALVWPSPPRPPLTEEHRSRRKLVFFIDALLFRRVILPIGIEHPRLPAVFEATRGLRTVAYALEAARGGALDQIPDVTEYVREGEKVGEVKVALGPHRCLGEADGRDGEGDGEAGCAWRCALGALGASDAALTALLPEALAASRPLRLTLHLLRWLRGRAAATAVDAATEDDRRLARAGACVARALLALILMRGSGADANDAKDAQASRDYRQGEASRKRARSDRPDEAPTKRARSDFLDLNVYLEVRWDSHPFNDQRSPGYLGLLHHFNMFQASLVSLIMFLQAHLTRTTEQLPPLHSLLVGRFVYGLGSDLLTGRVQWEAQCLPGLADWLGRRSGGEWGDAPVDKLRRLADWVFGGGA